MESVFYGIDTSLFQDVHGVSALLSAAEMLSKQSPEISSAFIQFAAGLVENFLIQTGSSPEHDEAFAPLIKLSNEMKETTKTSAKAVERFADALIAASDGQNAIDFCRLAYLAYSSCSIFGRVHQRVLLKLAKVETMIGVEKNNLNLTFSSAVDEVDEYQSSSPLSAIQSQDFQNSQEQQTQELPAAQQPTSPQMPPQQPIFQPPPFQPIPQNIQSPQPQNDNQTANVNNINQPVATNESDTKTIERLAEIAKDAFSAGQMDIALTALNAAISELQKK